MTNRHAQIVAFPFPKRDWNDCEDPREAVFQLKLEAAKLLNEVANGRYVMDETNIRGLHRLNALCEQVSLSPVEF